MRKGWREPSMPMTAITSPRNPIKPPIKIVVTPGLDDFSTVTNCGA